MLNETIISDILENNAKSTDILIKHYTSIILHCQLRHWVLSEVKKYFYKLYYTNPDNFCVIQFM